MSRRRSRLEIVLSVLSVVADGSDKPTHIMYATNMSWNSTQKILSKLVELGLLEVEHSQDRGRSRRRYMITEKGIKIIDYYDNASDIMPIEKLCSGE